MNNSIKPTINVVAFQEAGGWVAQCLQYDIAVQANSLADLQREFQVELASHVFFNIERGRAPFDGLDEAPPKFWKMYSEGTPLSESEDLSSSEAVKLPDSPPPKPEVAPVRYKISDDCREPVHAC